MKVIKLNAITSTNTYLKELLKETTLDDQTIVLSEEQISGRGQMGAGWYSKKGESLTFSMFKRFGSENASPPKSINLMVSLALINALNALKVPNVKVKWPNDILSYNRKICGILIENQWQGDQFSSSVIGIGLNVNNTEFKDLPRASSMKLASGSNYDLDEVFKTVVEHLQILLQNEESTDFNALKRQYEAQLFGKDKVYAFEVNSGQKINGIIRGIDEEGMLKVELEDESIKTFGLKEIKLLF